MAKRMGRPPKHKDEKAKGYYVFLTPQRRDVAAAIGDGADDGVVAKGIYALLDHAEKNPALVAKLNKQRRDT